MMSGRLVIKRTRLEDLECIPPRFDFDAPRHQCASRERQAVGCWDSSASRDNFTSGGGDGWSCCNHKRIAYERCSVDADYVDIELVSCPWRFTSSRVSMFLNQVDGNVLK